MESDNSSVPLQSSQAVCRIPTGIYSLPLELVGLIAEEVTKNEGMNTNTRSRTCSIPAFVRSLKCDVGQPWRGAYLFALDTCNKDFVHSLHFANGWKFLMDGEERQLVRNIVVKYVPGQSVSSKQAARLVAKKSAGKLSSAEAKQYYSMVPLPEDLNRSLNDLPKLRTVQMEFKTFLAAFKTTYLGMFRVLKSFFDDHEGFKLEDAMIEPRSNAKFSRVPNKPRWEIGVQEIERILITEITEIAGRDVCFLLANNIWKLEDADRRKIAAENTAVLNLENISDLVLGFQVARELSQCTWTFIFERAVRRY
ncbi:1753165e-3a0e-41e8-b79d-c0f124d03f37 [Sclerotinia trifoliorum]|uniref:1753165e-3a0e-41e8-b79d-c0f124d03f37 n=1 Tax=Sclerotinia trifoliorum TaxID=28548 RepID=A0A8H2W337_9HELO|nr:1753165e-3a0e-41e8-b79d-c0f124d03f37 [Sclerotinia trifoliorum]